ncbi:hypothetical protein WMY93_029581 [Mugilogobius chulae]|uniref:Uncharacterized protein n=1 Tax=Mugilogobius chulae TaxID=88201 RepID=A0AAW0MVG6_9GOBI
MSTRDVSEPRLGGAGGETETPLSAAQARTHAKERKQEETNGLDSGLEALNTTKQTGKALKFSSKIFKDYYHTDKTDKATFTSHFSLKLGSKPKTEPDVHNKDSSTNSFHGPSPVCDQNIFYRVHDLTVDRIPLHLKKVKKKPDCISIETSSATIQSFSNGRCGLHKENTPQMGHQRKGLLLWI